MFVCINAYSVLICANNSSTRPLPNPPFVFPIPSDVTSETQAHGSVPSNPAVTGSRRAAPRSRPQQLSKSINREFQKAPEMKEATHYRPSNPVDPVQVRSIVLPTRHVHQQGRHLFRVPSYLLEAVNSLQAKKNSLHEKHFKRSRRWPR